jgi:hypothetical protein
MKKITVEYTVDESVVAPPTFSLESGEIPVGSVVTISCATNGASIYYTLDGTDPTTESTLYSEGVTINESCTLKAIAVKEGRTNSTVTSATYTAIDPSLKKITWTISGVETSQKTTADGMNLKATISPTDATGTWFAQNGTTDVYYATASGAQMGSGKTSFNGGTITLKDASIPYNAEIQSISISSKAASSASFTVKASVGGVTATNSATVNSTSVATYTIDNIKLNGNTIVLNVSGTASKAFYLTEISVSYKEVELDPSAAPATPAIEGGRLEDGKYVVYADENVTFKSTNAEYITVNGTKVEKTGEVFVYTPNFVLDTTEELTVIGYSANDVASDAATFTLSYETKYGTAEHPYSVAQALKVITDGKYTSDMVYTHGYVTTDDIKTVSTNYRTYYITDKDSATKLMVYKGKGLNNANFADGDLVSNAEVVVYGALTLYGTTPEVASDNYLVSYTAPVVPTPETPAFVEKAGIVDAGIVVHLTCATEGVSIYYTTNGDTPTAESTLYTSDGITVNQTTTIKAVAINQGVKSAIATATYVCFTKEEGATSATFDFAKVGLVSDPFVDYPTTSASIDGVTFMCNDVTMSVDKNGGSNDPVWFVSTAGATSGQTEARVYTNAILTFKNTAEKGLITSIVFSQTKNSTKWADPTASVDGDIVEAKTEDGTIITKTFTPKVPDDSIVFTSTGTCAFSNVVVNYAFGEIPVLEDVSCSATSIEFTTAPDVKVYYQVKDEQVANSELAAEDWVVATEDAGIEGLDVAADDEIAIYQFTSPLVTAGKYLYVKPVNDQFTGEISVLTFDVPTGIEGVEADANAPVEYFNLQGIRIANPSRGIYVKRQGSAVTKVLVK